MGKARRVVLWGREDVLGRSVEMFLSRHKDWEVIRLSGYQDDEGLIELIARQEPDTAILYLGNCSDNPTLPTQLIQQCPGLKVITVSLGNNTIEVYCRQEVTVEDVDDLLIAVEG